jgi:hypothetical protein
VSSFINIALGGADRLIRQLKLANPATRAAVQAVIRRDSEAIATSARENAPKRTGEMVGTIRTTFSGDGLIGYVRVGIGKLPRRGQARRNKRGRRISIGPGAYAPVVEHGDRRRNRNAEPFLDPAFQGQKPQTIVHLKGAMDGIVDDIAR